MENSGKKSNPIKQQKDNPERDSSEKGEAFVSRDFIRTKIDADIASGKFGGRVVTRFPPEPNGYLHIGHAKAICLNFGLAEEFDGGVCHLRFDDTNPCKEDEEYVQAIMEDVKWLGYDWGENLFYASNYFERLYEGAIELVKKGQAYVCSLSAEEVRQYRGTLTEPGKNSPYRDRSIEENLDLFQKMRAGDFAEGEHTLRAKIDMSSGNLNMRDPALYRIRHAEHQNTGDAWCIYPMYDYTHPLSDAFEGITHSLCTLEFEDHRPLYDWALDHVTTEYRPEQTEFARLNLSYTILSKRKLLELVELKIVDGWNDPRMPTLSGIRRRGYTPASLRMLCDRVGMAKSQSVVDIAMLEFCIREELNKTAPRVMAVLDPLKLVITNYPEGENEELEAENNPEDPEAGKRLIPFSRELYIEQSDFLEDAPRKFFRLAPGKEVRLKNAYYITCTNVVKNESGKVVEVHCTYDPKTKGGWSDDGRKVKGTLHWVSVEHAIDAEVRLYDHLFCKENPDDYEEGQSYRDNLNPDSLVVVPNAKLEPSLAGAQAGNRFQFLRTGYFCVDPEDSSAEKLVFNRTVALKDTWAKKSKN